MPRRALLTGLPAVVATQRKPAAPNPSPRKPPAALPRTLSMGQGTSALTLDPAHGGFTLFPGGVQVGLCLYDGLLTFDANLRPVPQLAVSYTMAPNLMSCTLRLRPHLRFHDDTPLDAAAAKLNLERLMNPQLNPTNRVLGDKLAAIDAPNAETIIIHTSAPYQQLPHALAHPSGVLVSPAAIAGFGDAKISAHPVGAGPYRLASFTPAEEVVLEPFEAYWGGRPRLGHLRFKTVDEATDRLAALRRNDFQVIDTVPASRAGELQQDMAVTVTALAGLRTGGVAINMTRGPLMDLRVRRALNLAVSLPQIVDQIFFGYASVPNAPLAFAADGYAPVGQLVCDPAAALALLAQAGYGPNNPLALTLFAPGDKSDANALLLDLVAGALRQVHVALTVRKIAGGAYWDELRLAPAGLKWDLALFGFQPENASGLHHLNMMFRSNPPGEAIPGAWNIGQYRNPEVDRLLDAAGNAATQAMFGTSMRAAQALIWRDAPYLWLPIADVISASRANVADVDVLASGITLLRRAF
jgi:ABC-type transport system substrate-binding protein